MQLTELSIKSQNVFVQHYIDGKEEMSSFFDYNIHNSGMWRERLDDVSARTFAREELADYLSSYHSKFDSAAMQASIEKIKDPSSVAVVGGQQAGLLTGPLYTIHKIISIIVFAKQHEEELKVPVIPLFWVAGEDHDLEEINYVHTSEQNSPVKKKLPQSYWKKSSAANTSLDQEKCAMWIDEVFASFEETDHTNTLIEHVKRCLRDSTTFTDFFEHLIAAMFQEEGLVLLNSGDPGIKKLETAMFQKILRLNGELANSVAEQQLLMNQTGYQPIIESGKDQANLFYEYETERFLIEKDNAGFIVRELELTWTEDELYIHMEENPERFSNNVVTRPLMQEYLIPTLAFIAGPGEVNYWGELKQAFGLMDFKMPPVVPRLNITIVERHIEKKLSERNISLKEAIEGGTKSQKDAYFESQIPEQFTELINNAKAEIETIHKNIRQEALKVDSSMAPLLQKNAAFIQDQLRFLERTVTKRIEEKEGYVLRDYEKIQNSIKPLLAPQERIWNIMYYLNRYGPKFFTTFKHLPFSFQNQHQVVKL